MSRGKQQIRYDDLPADRFPGHCDLVVATGSGAIDVIGGNVDNSVSMKHVPVAADGRLNDTDYPWFVILRVQYDR